MKTEHQRILKILADYLTKNPSQRFGQAIFNLGINEFKQNEEFQLRDIYNDSDSEIIQRLEKRLDFFDSQQ